MSILKYFKGLFGSEKNEEVTIESTTISPLDTTPTPKVTEPEVSNLEDKKDKPTEKKSQRKSTPKTPKTKVEENKPEPKPESVGEIKSKARKSNPKK